LKPRERYFDELAYPAADDAEYKRQPGFFRAELHERFSSPLYPFAFVMVTLALVGQAQSTRTKRWQGVAAAVLAGFALRVAGLGFNNLVVLNERWLWLMYGWPVGAIVLSLLMIWYNARPRMGRPLGERVGIAIGDLWSKLRPAKSPAESAPQIARSGART
jgi:lipopolysaccharide export system permease protein